MSKNNKINDILSNTNIFEFSNGLVLNVFFENGFLYAGTCYNVGPSKGYFIKYDDSITPYQNIENLYNLIIEKNPDLI